MAGFGEVQEQYTKDLERDLKQARKEINNLERQLNEARELVFTAYREGWSDSEVDLDCLETNWIESDSRHSLEKLKDKGDE